jgi:hypothetical protein
MAGNAMVIAAHPLHSPNLAPVDFYLLGHVGGLPGRVIRGWGAIVIGGRWHLMVLRKVDFDEGFSRVDDESRAMY